MNSIAPALWPIAFGFVGIAVTIAWVMRAAIAADARVMIAEIENDLYNPHGRIPGKP